MAKGLQRLYCNKGSLRWHLPDFSDVCASYLQGIFILYRKKRFTPVIITASWKALHGVTVYGKSKSLVTYTDKE